MPRELLLFCQSHLTAGAGEADMARPLKDKAKRRAQRLGVWIAQHASWPDVVITAPAQRSRTAGQKTVKAGGRGAEGLRVDPRLFGRALEEHLDLVAEQGASGDTVMLVGHLPGLDQLARFLLGSDSKEMSPGTLLWLALPEGGSSRPERGSAEVIGCIHADDLPEKFPYPGPHGAEARDRPAYYYDQSAVIPYRHTPQGVEILVILSSKKKHWVVPKGIHDPGFTAQESAAKEAEEEAGVRGDVGDQAVGTYVYEKWGAPCSVTVYPMMVRDMLDLDQWAESHRTRHWVSPGEAVRHLKQDGLKDVVRKFAAQCGQSAE